MNLVRASRLRLFSLFGLVGAGLALYSCEHRSSRGTSESGVLTASRRGAPPVPTICPDARDAGSTSTDGGAAKVRFAVLGDFGSTGPAEEDVARLIKGWSPEFIITTGDNNYPNGAQETIDLNIGQYYHEFIAPYIGSFGCGARTNRFFPSLGNHDWITDGAKPYFDYFKLPGNERYYEYVWGNVHLFALDSDTSEPDGTNEASVQATWLKQRLAASTATWKIVFFHHPPFSSGPHGPNVYMQWPFKAWGASLVLSGHDHDYERLEVDGFPYAVIGLGGASIYSEGTPAEGSQSRYDTGFGAGLIEADATSLRLTFMNTAGLKIDELVLTAPTR